MTKSEVILPVQALYDELAAVDAEFADAEKQEAEAASRKTAAAVKRERLLVAIDVVASVVQAQSQKDAMTTEQPSPTSAPDSTAPESTQTVAELLIEAASVAGADGSDSKELFARVRARRPETTQTTLETTLSKLVKGQRIHRDGRLYFQHEHS